jgi:hypothetical protein
MRWYTCTPVAFGGGADFFARDSGLLCRGLQSIGCDSRAVMPGERLAGDQADLIRTDYINLESADWWRSHDLDGVVLYAWGRPRFRRVAQAIHDAGVFLVLNQDNGGLVSPLAGFSGWIQEQRVLAGGMAKFLRLVVRGLTVGLFVTDPLRAMHLKYGNVIACVSPAAAVHYRRLCKIYGGQLMADRVQLVPHPVEPLFIYQTNSKPKVRQIACIGRWQDEVQKRPGLLQDTLTKLLAVDGDVTVEIIGERTASMDKWHAALALDLQLRIRLRGRIDRRDIAQLLQSSQVFYSPSAFESFGIAAGEALCSGCSVVSGKSSSLGSFEWFVSEKSGTLADTDDLGGHLAALQAELANWDRGLRSAKAISSVWSERLHADKVAARVLQIKDGH